MSKYDFSLDLSDNSSTGLMIKKIKENSVVLEFGCATGRMTKYMAENLNCKVYIVEYDRSAYEVALQFATDGICDDIMDFAWLEKFEKIRFDAILFADVLEHLSDPERVIRECSKLLKEDGQIHISIPNITHNDVLLRFLHDDVNYTKVGLLDDTHVHFWGLDNIKNFAEHCGLYVSKIEATYCPTGMTEQRPAMERLLTENVLLYDILKQRTCGEVYQFLFDLQRKDTELTVSLKNPVLLSHVYLDHGEGFNSQDVLEVCAEYIGENMYQCHLKLEDTENIKALRFDPVEMQNCVIQTLSVYQGEKMLTGVYSENVMLYDGILMLDIDPQVVFKVNPGNERITLEARFALPGIQLIQALQNQLQQDQKWKQEKNKEAEANYEKIDRMLSSLEKLEQEKSEAIKQSKSLEIKLEKEKENAIQMTTAQRDYLQTIAQLQKEKEALNSRLQEYMELLDQKERIMLSKENELNYYKSLSTVSLGIKLRGYNTKVKKLLGKVETH